jgi:hypothetical protein
VHWADVVLVATPIRWGPRARSTKMVERMNCVQNQITIREPRAAARQGRRIHHHRRPGQRAGRGRRDAGLLRRDRLPLPPFPYVAHSRGWSAEDMENNVRSVETSADLREGTCALLDRAVELARRLRASHMSAAKVERGGRKAHKDRVRLEE